MTFGANTVMNRNFYTSAPRSGYGTKGGDAGARFAQPVFAQNMCLRPDDGESDGMVLAMAYVPRQSFTNLYSPKDALAVGTLFGELNLPYCMGGRR